MHTRCSAAHQQPPSLEKNSIYGRDTKKGGNIPRRASRSSQLAPKGRLSTNVHRAMELPLSVADRCCHKLWAPAYDCTLRAARSLLCLPPAGRGLRGGHGPPQGQAERCQLWPQALGSRGAGQSQRASVRKTPRGHAPKDRFLPLCQLHVLNFEFLTICIGINYRRFEPRKVSFHRLEVSWKKRQATAEWG